MEINNKKEIEELAIILWRIHSHSLNPFYEGKHIPWSSLKVKETNKDNVDKAFFRNMSEKILNNQINLAGNGKIKSRQKDKIEFTIELYLQKCIGLCISDVWRGEGKSIFIELGKLHYHKNGNTNVSKGKGDVTLMFDCRWRLEALNSIKVGSLDEANKIEKQTKLLIGKSVKNISFIGRLPEIVVELEKNLWLQSFTSYKSEDWTILFNKDGTFINRKSREVLYRKIKK